MDALESGRWTRPAREGPVSRGRIPRDAVRLGERLGGERGVGGHIRTLQGRLAARPIYGPCVCTHVRILQALNPNVEAPTATILHNLASHLDVQRPGTVYAARQQEGETCGLVLALSTKISGLPYQWEFRCTEPPTQNVSP